VRHLDLRQGADKRPARPRPLGLRAARGLALAVGLLALGHAPAARAYVRYTSGGVAFAWPQSCVFVTGYPSDFVSLMPLDEIENAANAAAAAWSTDAAGPNACTYLAISVSYSTATPPRAINDHHNSLLFRVTSWCEILADGSCSVDIGAYDPAALAVTSVVANKDTGQIRDADIEVNAADHHWGDLVLHPELATSGGSYQDLQNALTHEMGHLIGLDHSCYQPASGLPHPLDNTGNPAPDCDQAPAGIKESTMFPSADPGDLTKRSLSDDDQLALCEIYPVAKDPMICDPNAGTSSGCSCGVASGAGSGGVSLLALGALGLWLRRGRSRRGARV
jgi:MYXO-CTERM domain-containing protein